ncbi:MAG: amidohydrolase [Candidatus Brockarchaeota archaeon]|nr:amidohydrolase [Candidatus Brockarchaeota archaeon]
MGRVQVVDSHVHLKHGDAERTEFGAEEIVEAMDAAGIDKSIVFAMSTTTRRSIEMAREASGKFPERLIPYVYALPSYERPVLEEIDRAVTEYGFRGIKLHAGECTLAEYVADPVVELAGELRVPCLIDCSGRIGDIARMAAKFPKTNLIVAHLGMYLCKDGAMIDRFIDLAENHRNVYLDTSGVVLTEKVVDAVRRAGSDRVVFGTDGPANAPDTASYAKRELEKITGLNLDPKARRAILAENILRLIGIRKP